MDTTEPPLKCEQCGEPVWPGDDYKVLTAIDEDTGEPTAIPGKVVHQTCWRAWVETNDVQ